MKTISAYILSLALCLTLGTGLAFGGTVPAEPTPSEQHTTVKVQASTLIVENTSEDPVDLAVYTITGTMAYHGTIAPGERAEVELRTGIYIVKAGDRSSKVAVR